MIFVTVGAQMPFDRLIHTVDEWALSRGRTDVLAQIGASNYQSKSIQLVRFMNPLEFRERVEASSIVVAHAGMGTIITALEFGKPVIVMPRQGKLGETRNDHQVATAMKWSENGWITVASDEKELIEKLDETDTACGVEQVDPQASPRLIAAIRNFIQKRACLRDLPPTS